MSLFLVMPSPSRIGVCLAIGALTTVIVAWVLALRVVVPLRPMPSRFAIEGMYRGSDGEAWWYQVHRRPGLTVVVRERSKGTWFVSTGEGIQGHSFPWRGRQLPDAWLRATAAGFLQSSDIPGWARQPRHEPAGNGYLITAASGRGWPCRALWYEAIISPGTRVNRGGIDLPRSFRELGPGPVLPYRILAVGFSTETAFFAALWMLLLAAPGVLRRVRRHRGGQCLECGYDLRHVGHDRCPECGAATGDDERTPFQLVWRAWASRSTSQ